MWKRRRSENPKSEWKKQIVLRQSLCVTATKAGAASPLPTLELSLSISCYKTHLSFHLFGTFCLWTWFFDSGFKIDCTLYNISSWFKGMLMLENFCHIITLLTSSSVILCWFWSLQITGKRTNNLLVIKLFNWAWLSAAPGSCWCCQLIFCSIQLIWNANQSWDGSPADSLCLSAAQLILSEVDAWPASASGPLRTSCFRPTLH